MERPESVPDDAEWSEDDNEWVLGFRDDDGAYQGEVRYWRPDGTLVSIASMRDDEPHGICRRFHQNGEESQFATYSFGVMHGLRTWTSCDDPTTEVMHTGGVSTEIWRAEVEYNNGAPASFRWFLRDGTEVDPDGTPLRVRPDNVPLGALFNPQTKRWIAGTWDERGERTGAMRTFVEDGTPLSLENYQNNVAHGVYELYFDTGGVRGRWTYEEGELVGPLEFFSRDGAVARRATISHGQWVGPIVDYSPDGSVTQESRAPEVEPAPELPAGGNAFELATTIAVGWSGDENRDAVRARRARAHVRGLRSPHVQAILRATGLDTAPRLITVTRLEKLCTACEGTNEIDVAVLRHAMAVEGGVGASAAVANRGAAALAALRARLNAHGKLDLQRLALTELPPEIRYLTEVAELDASNNRLRGVPGEISDSMFLRRLNLTANTIESLPPELKRLSMLRRLDLAQNGLTEVPEVVCRLPELQILNLSNNGLTTLPPEFGNLRRLDTLWLGGNPLTTLPKEFGNLPGLTFLHLGDLHWATPPECIWEVESLESLWLASRHLTHLPVGIARLRNLRSLMIWYSGLTELPAELFAMTHLRELRVRENPLPSGTVEALREALPDCTIY